jgi:Kae1-associated kinase Bud32
MEVIAKGAEANLYLEDNIVLKERIRKEYRIPEIDEALRSTRTKREAKLLSLARRAGVPTPVVLDVDNRSKCITMSYVDGEKVKYIVDTLSEEELNRLFSEIGSLAAKLHRANIIHGDLTTSNMLLSQGRVFFIDFGLGEVNPSLEAKGTDLLVFRKSVRSTHYRREKEILEAFFSGYRSEYPEGEEVIERMKRIEKRGRYVSAR